MKFQNLLARFARYALIGIGAAATHGIVLVVLGNIAPLWLSNLCGFLSGSLISYLGHALYTFKKETFGKPFARRWLIIQFIINLSISALLPVLLNSWSEFIITKLVFIFTPTFINIIIWSKAAKFSLKRNIQPQTVPNLHVDDLGLTRTTNEAIKTLSEANIINSTSLLINGNDVQTGLQIWRNSQRLDLNLHLCLTEGPSIASKEKVQNLINEKGLLSQSFSQLLAYSFLPKYSTKRQQIEAELHHEIVGQINLFKILTGLKSISIDGHQHIHLVPIVLDILLDVSHELNITWIRTTSEKIPTNLPLKFWKLSLLNGGTVKWAVLQALTFFAEPKIKHAKISTNAGFAGVLFTGHMIEKVLKESWKELERSLVKNLKTRPIILSHPATYNKEKAIDPALNQFPLSSKFARSPWRQKELEALINLANKSN